MTNFDLHKPLEELMKKRKIFNSEADFQFALAWEIKKMYDDIDVFLEYYFDTDEGKKEQKLYVDIMLKKGEYYIPIELKYRKRKLKNPFEDNYSKQSLSLTDQGAQDQGRYWFLYDVHRIEKIKEKLGDKCEKGYAVFLTNDKSYKTGPTKKTKCYNFRICENRKINKDEKLYWAEGTAKSSTGNGEFQLKNDYELLWKQYSKLTDSDKDNAEEFNYLLIEVK